MPDRDAGAPASDNDEPPHPTCSFENCRRSAKWRQFNPPSRSHPLFLCTEHWLQVRMDRPELIVAYGWMSAFPESDWGDPYKSKASNGPKRAAYEIPGSAVCGNSIVVVGNEANDASD